MDDLISRQAAIDALERQAKEMSRWAERYTEQAKGVLTAKNVIEDLPSAQPENKQQATVSNDCISRQAAIDALKQQAETMSEWSNRYAEQRKRVLTAVNIVIVAWRRTAEFVSFAMNAKLQSRYVNIHTTYQRGQSARRSEMEQYMDLETMTELERMVAA